MAYKITWPKDQKDKAKELNMSLFAAGYYGKSGRYEAMGPCNDESAQAIFFLACELSHGIPVDQAVEKYKETVKGIHKNDAANVR